MSDREAAMRAAIDLRDGEITKLRSALAARNDELRSVQARLREAQARADESADYTVHIVPGERHIPIALAQLDGDPSVKDGDRIRVSQTGIELVREAGIWTAT